MPADTTTPIILCGGAGSRLWPASREAVPKQFLPLFDGKSLFDMTLRRIADPAVFSSPVIVTAAAHAPLVLRGLQQADMSATILLEPCRRNTAPAIALAIEACGVSGGPMLVLASDHYISDTPAFRRAVQESEVQARAGRIVTFGVEPDSPHTGYGYIEKGLPLGEGAFAIARFIEKPNHEVACSLLARGCLWNSGNFMFMPEVMQSEIARHQPAIAAVARQACQGMTRTDEAGTTVLAVVKETFMRAPDISIDYAVLEHSALGACKPVNYRWSDMGTWNALWEHQDRDAEQNAVFGPATLLNTQNALVLSEAQHVAVVGMSNIAVVATPDAILVAPRTVGGALSDLLKILRANPETSSLT